MSSGEGESEGQLLAEKRKKIAQLRADGLEPYANGFRVSHTSAGLKALAPELPAPEARSEAPIVEGTFRVAGRVMAKRSAFCELVDREGRLQLYFKKDALQESVRAKAELVDRGDFIGVEGHLFYTKRASSKDDLCLFVKDLQILTKAVRPLPEKWHGLVDVETRYRQRYLDLVTNRKEVQEVFRKRSRIIQMVRGFLDKRGFLEVETPMMHSVLGGAAARPFATHHNALDLHLYMRIAPELYLKRLLVGGLDRVYEIGRNFRNEGMDRQHNPEFTMLEFYQAYATYEDLIALTEELFCELAQDLCGGLKFPYGEWTVDFTRPWPRISMVDAAAKAGAPVDDVAALEAFCEKQARRLGAAPLPKGAPWGKLIGWVFDALGEATLDPQRPTFVVDYPTETSPLSRKRSSDPRFVDRFELFVVGREHANAFSELNDPQDQRDRFAGQLDERAQGNVEAMEYDEDYCQALEYGMPPAAGEGIGIDRLVMLLCNQPSIRDVILFPLMRPHHHHPEGEAEGTPAPKK